MSAYLKRLQIGSVQEVGVDTDSAGAYLKRVEIVEVVDSDGNPWEPVPGPDPWDELVVAQKATWSDDNVYAVGEDIVGVSATYAGGTDQVVYRSRVQHKSATDTDWNNSPWTNHTNTPQVIHFVIPAGEENGQVRFQTQARDNGVDPVDQVNSFASVKQIDDLDWDPITATVNDVEYDLENAPALTVLINDPLPIVVTHNGAITDASYQWETRNPPAPPLFGTPNAKNTVVTFTAAGYYVLTLTLSSPKSDELKSVIVQFYAVDAFD
jgi:hypothetical protein